MKPTIEEARDYPRTMGAALALKENLDYFDDALLIRCVEIAIEAKDDMTRIHVEQAVKERKADDDYQDGFDQQETLSEIRDSRMRRG